MVPHLQQLLAEWVSPCYVMKVQSVSDFSALQVINMLLVSQWYHSNNKEHSIAKKFFYLRGMDLKMTTASLTPSVLVPFLILLMCTTVKCCDEGQNISCVSRYHEFEEAAITNNSDNVDALFSKLYKPNQPLPYSLTVLYQVRLENGTTQRISSDPTCPSELWMWTYSPVFLLAEPSLFNRFTLYTINYFRPWKSPTVTLTVPRPCEGKIFDFLNRMTMSVSWEHAVILHSENVIQAYSGERSLLLMPVCI